MPIEGVVLFELPIMAHNKHTIDNSSYHVIYNTTLYIIWACTARHNTGELIGLYDQCTCILIL